MPNSNNLSDEALYEIDTTIKDILSDASVFLEDDAEKDVRRAFDFALKHKGDKISRSGRHAIYKTLDVAKIVVNEIGLGTTSLISALLYDTVKDNQVPLDELSREFSPQVYDIIHGLNKVSELYDKSAAIETENFKQLLLTFAQDIRVILIMVADRLQTMRYLEHFSDNDQLKIARETSYLYAPLAHRLGLYSIKSELEDLSLKYSNRTLYKEIAQKLQETKRARDAYIKRFITPINEKLKNENFKFEIKGRTKTIFSILNKMKKNIAFEDIYDLFAIRIIIDTKLKNEKPDCWKVKQMI